MLYLEDYLEMIEHLPQELRDRFTEMREMDLQVQNSMDSLEKQMKLFFSKAKKMKPAEREAEHASILKDYYKTLEDADEKVQLASQIYDLVDRYLRRLDQELHKFKMELEADNKGITEVLEKRSLELDQPIQNSSQKENRYSLNVQRSQGEKRALGTPQGGSEKKLMVERGSTATGAASSAGLPTEARPVSTSMAVVPATPPLNFTLSHIGAGSSAIAAAASQAIAATQQMQQGRRTASLKASYEAINTGIHPHELSIGRELAGAAQTAITAASVVPDTTKKQKKKGSNATLASVPSPLASGSGLAAAASASLLATLPVNPSPPSAVTEEPSFDGIADPNADNPDWTYDPNEPRYCVCNQVSYGDMVACDNEDCPFEWFHYPCVNITAPPKGKWFCPQCTQNMKRRGSRK